MDNGMWGLLMALSALGCGVLLGVCIRRREARGCVLQLGVMCAVGGLWSLCSMLFFLLDNEKWALLFNELRFFCMMAESFAMFHFVYCTLRRRKMPRVLLYAAGILLAVQLGIILLDAQLHLMRSYIAITYIDGIRSIDYRYGPWFAAHCAISYLGPLAAVLMLLYRFVHVPRRYRAPVVYMMLGIGLVVGGTVVALVNGYPWSVDPTALFLAPSLCIFCFSLFCTRSLDQLLASRSYIFENMEQLLMVLGPDGEIVDFNKPVGALAQRLHFGDPYGRRAEELLGTWQSAAQGRVFADNDTIFAVTEDCTDIHYQVTRMDVTDERGRRIGACISVKNITPIMAIIHSLQDLAFYDHLTQLPNRRYFERRALELDRPENYPLCIMVGDVNGLKQVNDRHGHAKGDVLLRRIAAIMHAALPEGAVLARVGGDEFLCAIPHTDDKAAASLTSRMEALCADLGDPLLHGASIALGYTVKTGGEKDICGMVDSADRSMYQRKWNARPDGHAGTAAGARKGTAHR